MDNYFWFSLFIVINSLVLFLLAANVSRLRMKLKISMGDDGNKTMRNAIRAHCNGLEQVPVFALILLALTFQGGSNLLISALVISFSTARLIHAYGMLGGNFLGRRIGAGLTYLLQLVAIIGLVIAMLG